MKILYMRQDSHNNEINDTIKPVSWWKITIPIVLGLVVIAWLFLKDFKPEVLSQIEFSKKTFFWLFVALLCMLGRDFGYMIRIRGLSENKLTWRQSFRIIMLWEFTSTVTPTALGGTSVALLYVHKEGISLGKSTAMVMTTSLFDELYFVVMVPLLLLFVSVTDLFNIPESPSWSFGIVAMTIIGYIIKFVWIFVIVYGLFINPRGLARLVYRLSHIKILKRWKRSAARLGKEIEISSGEMKGMKSSFWATAFLSTWLSWTSRFLIVNCLFLAFNIPFDQILVFARQVVVLIVMLLVPTPGGSGAAEPMFVEYFGEFVNLAGFTGFAVVLALIWRLMTYYPYLIIGALIVPKWINDKFMSK